MRHPSRLATVFLFFVSPVAGADLAYKDVLLGRLVEQVPGILKSFDRETGTFGTGIWVCRDQHPMYPLAVAYTTKAENNRYFKAPDLLDVIVKAGDPLLQNMDERGQWVFAKKDGSTWGKIWMPWTYSRWIRTFGLIKDDMPSEDRKRWEEALILGYTGISKHCLGHVHNIPAHHAMGLYAAGKILDRPEWCEQAAEFLVKVSHHQREGGYWSEGIGPVVLYNFVYVDALGTYYAMSADERVFAALDKAAVFHRRFTYPGGQNVETVDQRNPYHDTIARGNVGFTFSPAGRAYLHNQWSRAGLENLDPDLIASLLRYGMEGPIADVPGTEEADVFVLSEDGAARAATVRKGPWFLCLSAYTAPVPTSRWTQDRQNLVSVYHDKVGLILGGGNTKLQPGWSNFTVGDTGLLAHTPGDTSPDFRPKGELYHVPSAAALALEPGPGLKLSYGPETCRIEVRVQDERTLECVLEATAESQLPVAAHLTLIPRMNQPLKTAAGQSVVVADEPITLSPEQIGVWVSHGGYRLYPPPTASLHWPVLPHNPYRKDGRAEPSEGRIEIRIPFDPGHGKYCVRLDVE
jgi:hypothetical protein